MPAIPLASLPAMAVVDEILELYRQRGDSSDFGEPVTQTEHALQSAWQATRAGAPGALVVAALLHDVGHLLHGGEHIAERGIDTRHESVGARWLARSYPPAITEPVRLHVMAKRYLCCVDPTYAAQLSAASRQSLALQGGALSAVQAAAFEGQLYWREAVQLRRWDEAAKVAGLQVPGFEHYLSELTRALR